MRATRPLSMFWRFCRIGSTRWFRGKGCRTFPICSGCLRKTMRLIFRPGWITAEEDKLQQVLDLSGLSEEDSALTQPEEEPSLAELRWPN